MERNNILNEDKINTITEHVKRIESNLIDMQLEITKLRGQIITVATNQIDYQKALLEKLSK